MSRKYDSKLKSELCEKLRGGARISDLVAEYGIPKSTISGWLKRSASGQKGEELEVGKLKRENEALYSLLGRVLYEQEFLKKKRYR